MVIFKFLKTKFDQIKENVLVIILFAQKIYSLNYANKKTYINKIKNLIRF